MIVGCCGDLLVGYKKSVRFVCFGFRCGSRFVSHESGSSRQYRYVKGLLSTSIRVIASDHGD